jgi:hypothetical protein
MSKQYGLRRRLKRLATADGIPIGRLSDWPPDMIADAIAEKWNAEWNAGKTPLTGSFGLGSVARTLERV